MRIRVVLISKVDQHLTHMQFSVRKFKVKNAKKQAVKFELKFRFYDCYDGKKLSTIEISKKVRKVYFYIYYLFLLYIYDDNMIS